VIGAETPYELVWVTAYRFSQRLADTFRLDRVFLAGDAAHIMSPFGARGLNSGVADAENLAWKLAWVLRGEASPSLLDTYEAERKPVARDNLAVTDATMRFLAPHGPVRRAWRNLVLGLAPRSAWFRRRVNSGSLAEPAVYAVQGSGPSEPGLPVLGSVAPDVSLAHGERLRDRLGRGFVAVVPRTVGAVRLAETVEVGGASPFGPGDVWLVRPDGHLAASVPLGEATPAALDELVARSVR
jgi:3-(3-hydroxy-phenyl)propionate hydroxylase